MQVVFDYVQDRHVHGVEEHWQLPAATHASRRGDCEDWALFALHILRANGHEARILAVFTEHEGHAVCVFHDGQSSGRICNEGLKRMRPQHASRTDLAQDRLARAIADSVFPSRWTLCSWVQSLRPAPKPSDVTGYVPHFEWIHPT